MKQTSETWLAEKSLTPARLWEMLADWVEALGYRPKTVLLIPPDFTRRHSWAGPITAILYELLSPCGRVDILPALGTHSPMNGQERVQMFGKGIPSDCFLQHDWRKGLRQLGVISSQTIVELSGGRLGYSVTVEVDRAILDEKYDLVVSIGQVVPHEVVGMANHNKNIFVGCGGKDMIDKSHFLGAVHGIENTLGRTETPVRRLFNEAEDRFLQDLPLHYILTVTSPNPGDETLHCAFIGRGRGVFAAAARDSREANITIMNEPITKAVVYLSPDHYHSTWLGNKAIYRTRMAMADQGELLIIAPGLRRFGEDWEIDRLIRKYGYSGTSRVLEHLSAEKDLQGSLSAAAHLIHGSSERRFRITYACSKLSREEIEGVGYEYMPLKEALRRYEPSVLNPGYHESENGEAFYFISDPALGLWAAGDSFKNGGDGL